jgi:4-amino-4-deoxy-L-arabinose transferase-like glycosyltransferase
MTPQAAAAESRRGFLASARSRVLFAAAVVAIYVSLTAANALTQRPRIDEGFFASPAYDLITNGTMGTKVFGDGDPYLKGIREHTYWVPPLDLLAQAAWYKIAGFSIFNMRMLATLWALAALGAWYLIMRQLTGDPRIALLAMAMVGLDYTFILCGASGRMDMMSAALGFSALASYLVLRERNLTWAVLASNALVTASGFTHPVGGYLSAAGVVFLTLYFDRKRIKVRHVALAAVPYLIGAAGWGWYIMQAPGDFLSQFGAQAKMDGRLTGLSSPWLGFWREITDRYAVPFGLGPHSQGNAGPIYLKALILLAYIAGVAGALLTKEIRRNRNYRALLYMAGIYFTLLSVLDYQKAYYYLIHILPFYGALLVIWMAWCWRERFVRRPAILAAAVALFVLQAGGAAYHDTMNTYARSYRPAIAFLKQHVLPEDSIIGSSAFGFGLGFDSNLRDDIRLGYYTGERPRYIIVNEEYEWVFRNYQSTVPDVYRFIVERLRNEYRPVYDYGGIRIFESR